MKYIRRIFIIILVFFAGSPLFAQEQLKAKADLYDRDGHKAGAVYFEQKEGIVRITVNIIDLVPGTRAIHIHENGICEPPDFKSAGSHFNPYGRQHGFLNPEGPHAGDLPNFEVGNNGMATFRVFTKLITLEEGEVNSVLKEGGTSVVIHEKPDDYITDPAGNAEERIACGVITQGDDWARK